MLNKFDDYPIHQTPEPVAYPATSDRNFYDRYWFNGYAEDGSWYFALGLTVYPHLGVMDCAFSVLEQGGRQHCFYGSRSAPIERTETQVGPFRLEVLEPLRRARVVLEDNSSGITCDLTFSTRTGAIEEARQTLWEDTRRWMDATRFDQFGRWAGQIKHRDGNIVVEASNSRGTKDRSWGVRNVGRPEQGGKPRPQPTVFFLWAPLIWKDHASIAIFLDGALGQGSTAEGKVTPFYQSEEDVPEIEDPGTKRMSNVSHLLEYIPGTRHVSKAEIVMVDEQGNTRTISIEPIQPLLRFHMKGLGYFHPTWSQGVWHGELETGGESFDPASLDLTEAPNIHVQQVVRASDGTQTTIGVLEHVCFGPYPRYGFKDLLDGAPA